MIAIGNAIASKKDMSIKSDKMTAFYNKNKIKNVLAEGNVVMKSPTANAFGDKMNYDVSTEIVTLDGAPAKIKTEKETITATDGITYYKNENKAIALGDVIAEDAQKNKIYSNKMVSYFEKNAKGSMEMNRVEIFDNVKIVTKDATVTAKRGEYLPKRRADKTL